MELGEIRPFVRFSRMLEIRETSVFSEAIPVDARLFYVESGEGRIEADGRVFVLPPYSMLYLNAGQPYRLLPGEVVYHAVNFDFTEHFAHLKEPLPPVSTASAAEKRPLEQLTFSDAPCFDRCCLFPPLPSLQSAFVRLRNAYEQKLPYYRLETSALLSVILLKAAQTGEKHSSRERPFDLQKVTEYIHDHYREEISNAVLAEVFHFHPNYISAEFRKHTGRSVHRYVLEVRILRAAALLESDSRTVGEIALACGFSDSNYFSRYFRRQMGVSPGEYRRTHGRALRKTAPNG